MRRRDIILDFTSLIDVVLIILFFFILFSHMEIEDNRALVETQIAEANEKITETENLKEQLEYELDLIRQSDSRRADNMEAMLDFGRSQNIKMILNMKENEWELYISSNGEVITQISSGSDVEREILAALSNTGYESTDTIFCEFILDGSEAGTRSAYLRIDRAIKGIKSTYKNLYYSETDISIVED